jgi:hypothetical protein
MQQRVSESADGYRLGGRAAWVSEYRTGSETLSDQKAAILEASCTENTITYPGECQTRQKAGDDTRFGGAKAEGRFARLAWR